MRCPKCDGRMWDNRLTKRNPKAPDFKCRDRSCDGVIWPPKGEPTKTEQVEKLAGKTIVNVLPKAVGIKLLDGSNPDWQTLPDEEKYYVEHLVHAQTQLPHQADKFTAGTTVPNQESIEIEIL